MTTVLTPLVLAREDLAWRARTMAGHANLASPVWHNVSARPRHTSMAQPCNGEQALGCPSYSVTSAVATYCADAAQSYPKMACPAREVVLMQCQMISLLRRAKLGEPGNASSARGHTLLQAVAKMVGVSHDPSAHASHQDL